MKTILVSMLAVLFAGCGFYAKRPIPVTLAGEIVKVGTDNPIASMKEIGPIEAIDGSGYGGFGSLGSYAGAYNKLKNKGGEMGATYIKIIQTKEPHADGTAYDNRFVIRGLAYK